MSDSDQPMDKMPPLVNPDKDGEDGKKVETENTENEAEIIAADDSLKKQFSHIDLNKVIDDRKLQEAEGVIDEEKGDLELEILDQVYELAHAQQMMLNHEGDSDKLATEMNDLSLRIKSNAGMIGYSLATEISKCLYYFLENTKNISDGELTIIKTQIDMLRLIFTEKIKGSGDDTAQEILKKFQEINRKRNISQ